MDSISGIYIYAHVLRVGRTRSGASPNQLSSVSAVYPFAYYHEKTQPRMLDHTTDGPDRYYCNSPYIYVNRNAQNAIGQERSYSVLEYDGLSFFDASCCYLLDTCAQVAPAPSTLPLLSHRMAMVHTLCLASR